MLVRWPDPPRGGDIPAYLTGCSGAMILRCAPLFSVDYVEVFNLPPELNASARLELNASAIQELNAPTIRELEAFPNN